MSQIFNASPKSMENHLIYVKPLFKNRKPTCSGTRPYVTKNTHTVDSLYTCVELVHKSIFPKGLKRLSILKILLWMVFITWNSYTEKIQIFTEKTQIFFQKFDLEHSHVARKQPDWFRF